MNKPDHCPKCGGVAVLNEWHNSKGVTVCEAWHCCACGVVQIDNITQQPVAQPTAIDTTRSIYEMDWDEADTETLRKGVESMGMAVARWIATAVFTVAFFIAMNVFEFDMTATVFGWAVGVATSVINRRQP